MPNDTVEKPTTTDEGVWIAGPDGELVPDYDAAFPEINEGEVVHGTVVRVDKDEVLVDIGYKSEGVIPVAELTIRRSVNPADEVSLASLESVSTDDGKAQLEEKHKELEEELNTNTSDAPPPPTTPPVVEPTQPTQPSTKVSTSWATPQLPE